MKTKIVRPTCPDCQCAIIFIDYTDCFTLADSALYSAKGYCPVCKATYEWVDVYHFHRFDFLKKTS